MSKTVLIVDDNVISLEGMAVVLRREGYTVMTAEDGTKALDLLRTCPAPDIILLDMLIPPPGCDGWRFLEQRKRNPGLAAIPVIITTRLGIASPEWAAGLGASGYLKKPIDVQPLLTEIRRSLAM